VDVGEAKVGTLNSGADEKEASHTAQTQIKNAVNLRARPAVSPGRSVCWKLILNPPGVKLAEGAAPRNNWNFLVRSSSGEPPGSLENYEGISKPVGSAINCKFVSVEENPQRCRSSTSAETWNLRSHDKLRVEIWNRRILLREWECEGKKLFGTRLSVTSEGEFSCNLGVKWRPCVVKWALSTYSHSIEHD